MVNIEGGYMQLQSKIHLCMVNIEGGYMQLQSKMFYGHQYTTVHLSISNITTWCLLIFVFSI